MKLIISQYLATLKERNELDAILPDLLSEMGLQVYSRPGRGTRQDGVDVAAVGSLDGGLEKVYLFSIKAGNLTRSSWDGDSVQSLRPSLNEILDAYIPNRLPKEHSAKDIVICLCFGGDIQEQVRPQVEGFIEANTKEKVSFEEWNGDKLAALIQQNFLREELLPEHSRSKLRKSLALLDEPSASIEHFAQLVRAFDSVKDEKERLTAIRQINICLWILFAWAREAKNLEAAYLSGELVLLRGWQLTKEHVGQTKKSDLAVLQTFQSILSLYQQICFEYVAINVSPHTDKLHALSSAVRGSNHIDVNLRMFDVLGRLAMAGIWACWTHNSIPEEEVKTREIIWNEIQSITLAVIQMVGNNPVLLLPVKDEQAIDISIAMLFLAIHGNNIEFMRDWITEILTRAQFAHNVNGNYPCNVTLYKDLLDHPRNVEGYLEESTQGSILYPMIAFWACLMGDAGLYSNVEKLRTQHLAHCSFQLWFPDDQSESHIYINDDIHGATLSNLSMDLSPDEFEELIVDECKQSSHLNDLSVVKASMWPIVLVACRHYRLPVPMHYFKRYSAESESGS